MAYRLTCVEPRAPEGLARTHKLEVLREYVDAQATTKEHGRVGNLRCCLPRCNLIYLFMSRHEVHSMNTHTQQNAG